MRLFTLLSSSLLLAAASSAFGATAMQTNGTPPLSDPLMALMLSQPPIDVTSPVQPVSGFDPPVVRPGEDSTYRVTFNALAESIEWPNQINGLDNLRPRPGGRGQILALGPNTLQPRTSFNYHVRVSTNGVVTIPAFSITVYGKPVTVPAAQLEVTDSPSSATVPAPRLALQTAGTNLYVGQMLHFTVICPPAASLISQGFSPLELVGPGWLVDQTSFRQRYEAPPRFSTPGTFPQMICELTAAPLQAGHLSAFAQAFFVTRSAGPLILNGSGSLNGTLLPYTLLDSDPMDFQVKPLPREGVLPGFTGAVGNFEMGTPEVSTNTVRVGEPLTLRVKIRGDGNLARLTPPPAPKSKDWDIIVSRPDATAPQIIQAQNYTTFEFTFIPLTTSDHATPAIPFSYFDPVRAAYADLTISPVSVQVLPGDSTTDTRALAEANALDRQEEKEPALSGLATMPGLAARSLVPLQRRAWYPLLQLFPALVFLGLWSWDRRRRYLEAHPDILLRRRARRALRREKRRLEKASRAGDVARFAESAVAAMRVATAPHFPAEPRALVGADVVALLSENERSGREGEVIRKFFSATDAARYSTTAVTTQELLPLQPDLNRVLTQLEEKL